MVQSVRAPQPPAAPQPLPNIDRVAQAADGAKDDVDNLNATVTVVGAGLAQPRLLTQIPGATSASQVQSTAASQLSPGMQGLTTGLGVTSGALNGVSGLRQMVSGVERGDTRQVLSGAADVTTCAGTLAAVGIIGGAAYLTPLGGGLLAWRGVRRLHSAERSVRIEGMMDLSTSGTLLAALYHAPLGLCLGLGAAATGLSLARGLHRIRKGTETHDAQLRTRGAGELIAAGGIVALASGLSMAAPVGVSLLVLGLSMPLLQRVPKLRPLVNRVVDATCRNTYPLAVKAESLADKSRQKLAPVTSRVQAGLDAVEQAVSPATRPIALAVSRIEQAVMKVAQKGLHHLGRSKAFNALDRLVGKVEARLLPAEEPPPGA